VARDKIKAAKKKYKIVNWDVTGDDYTSATVKK
jgi:hypothetical protein